MPTGIVPPGMAKVCRTSAMLSKPLLSSSGGSSSATSRSRSIKSRTALPYSVRFRRWMEVRPGLGFASPGAVQRGFQHGDQTIDGGLIRPGLPERRHHSAAKLHDDLFPGFCTFRNAVEVHRIQRESRNPVVARCDISRSIDRAWRAEGISEQLKRCSTRNRM